MNKKVEALADINFKELGEELTTMKAAFLSADLGEDEESERDLYLGLIDIIQEEMASRKDGKEQDFRSNIKFFAYINLFDTLMNDAFDEDEEDLFDEDYESEEVEIEDDEK